MAPGARLSDRQIAVLQWVAEGCPDGTWPDETHKTTARALKGRDLVTISRPSKKWFAELTEAGRASLVNGQFPPKRSFVTRSDASTLPGSDQPPDNAAARAIRGLRRTPKKPLKQSKRQITEVYMRYKVVVTRVQVAERVVRAPSQEEAAKKVQDEFERPYGYFGTWKTVGTDLEVVEAEETTVVKPAGLSPDGPMLLSIKDAATALGISRATLYEMTSQGDLDYVLIGSRKLLSREKLLEFIDRNTHNGYHRRRY